MYIRATTPADLKDILHVEKAAFVRDIEANLTRDLLTDPSAKPLISLLAYIDDQPAGHILFTNAYLTNHPEVAVSFLAPLAVIPKYQKQGVGSKLIQMGLQLLSKINVDLVFVVGHPQYYPRSGFAQAAKLGFEATYPIPEKQIDAWMVLALRPNIIGKVSGRVICCDTLNKPELWRE